MAADALDVFNFRKAIVAVPRRPAPLWVLTIGLLVLGAAALAVALQLQGGYERRAVDGAKLTANTIIALTVDRNVGLVELRPGSGLTAIQTADLQADVDGLAERDLLLGLEVWRLDGSLAFADSDHPPDETQLREHRRLRALGSGDFMEPGDPSERGVPTWEVVHTYDPDGDGTVDGIVEIDLPATGQAEVDQATVRLYLVVSIVTLLTAAMLVILNRRLRLRQHEAMHDPLTGLGNRLALRLAGNDLIRRAPNRTAAALVLLDLDGFKAINDTLGHQAGDELLVQVARALRSLVRPSDLVVRLGGDEFAVLLVGPPDRDSALITARHIITGLAQHGFTVDGVLLDVHASAGVALRPDDADDVAGLLQRADVAMYQAKRSGAGVALYEAELDTHDVTKLQLLAELRRAIDDDELVLHYQPKADLHNGQVRAVEALVRWQHPERGLLTPDAFIPMAEHTGLMQPLTAWVLERACRQAAAWRKSGLSLAVAVNVSPRALLGGDLPTLVLRTLTATGLPAEFLELEITETAVIVDPPGAQAVLQQLRTMGVLLFLDDFGAGYTSMALLQTLPVHALKIDSAFVTGMLAGTQASAVAESLVSLAHRLGLQVVAEGVETADVWDRLRELGCEQAQGYHLARPMPAHQVDAWMTARGQTPKRIESGRRLPLNPVALGPRTG